MSSEIVEVEKDLISRRNFFTASLAFLGSVLTVLMSYPLAMFLWPRSNDTLGGKRSVKLDLSEVPLGDEKFIRFGQDPLIVINDNNNIVALSPICTHLGCIVKWKSKVAELHCPCHGGIFNTKGEVLGGPPPSPLPLYKVTRNENYIVIEEA
ncbi:MAG: ubiquinol-cytochrome c reductase iron-sulfur subunit [Nitrospinota bacterium]